MNRAEMAVADFRRGFSCSQAVLGAFADELGLDRSVALRLAAGFGGGMGRMALTCGTATGAFMAIGMRHGATEPDDARSKQHLGEVLMLWGNTFFDTGKDQEAVSRYRDALPFRPGDAELHGRLGVALARLGQYAEAQSELEACLKIDPTLEPAKRALDYVLKRK